MADTAQATEPSITEFLRNKVKIAEQWLLKPNIPSGMLGLFSSPIRKRLELIYGKDSPLLVGFPLTGIDLKVSDPRAELIERLEQTHRILKALEAAPKMATSPHIGKKIFIGHGRSLVWLQLKDFVRERMDLPCDEFNIQPTAGITTTARLEAMLAEARLAFVVMTAEEAHADGLIYARPNVIHECGLFQGKLGTHRAIILLENGCSEFSNIVGLTQIRFPKGNMEPAFEQIRRAIERELAG